MSDAQTSETSSDEPPRWRFVAIIPGAGAPPAAALSEREARAAWALPSALWHPNILRHAAVLPGTATPDSLGQPDIHDIRVTANEFALPSSDELVVVEAGAPRARIIEILCQRADIAPTQGDDDAARDFLALGTAYEMLLDLTRGMGHSDMIDHASLLREVQGAVQAWHARDSNGTRNHLRGAFELLTQARERFYPVDNFLLDLLLFDGSDSEAAMLATYLSERAACTLIATGRAVERLQQVGGSPLERVREAIEQGWLDVAGGPFDEAPEAQLPVESALWQYLRGARAYQDTFDGRNVETFARRSFGLYPMLPQILRRFGIRFGYHLALDGSRFPIPRESKRLWEAPDGSTVEVLARPPLTAHSEVAGREFPWRLARTLKEDHVATLPVVHRPHLLDSWFTDIRRAHAYSPVFGRYVTLGDYFQRTDKPWEPLRTAADEYESPYLSQAIGAGRTDGVSGLARHVRTRARLDEVRWLQAISDFLNPLERAEETIVDTLEEQLETETSCADAIEARITYQAQRLAKVVCSSPTHTRDGFLVINTLSTSRRCPVPLHDAAADLGAEGPLRASQFTEDGVWGVVELPPLGFAWVPSQPGELRDAASPTVRTSGNTLSNGIVQVDLDPTTGGIRSIRRPDEPSPRLAQQLVILGAKGPYGQQLATQMVADRVELEYGGPALAQSVSLGRMIDPAQPDRALATFRQRVRLWWGRPSAEVLIELTHIDDSILTLLADGDPWSHAIACRWAWADASSMVRRGSWLGLEPTKAHRPETAEMLEISNRGQRTAILTGGLAFHQRFGSRMLDTLLVSGREAERRFDFAVALDLEYPAHAALDFVTPPIVVAANGGPPQSGPAGWLLHLDMPSVAITRVEAIRVPELENAHGLEFHLLETAGRSTRGHLRLFRRPVSAWLADQHGERIIDLEVQDDAILIDLTPRELARIEVLLGDAG